MRTDVRLDKGTQSEVWCAFAHLRRHAHRHRHRVGAVVPRPYRRQERARLNVISHLLGQVPYEPLHRKKIKLPDRDHRNGYTELSVPRRYIPTPF